MAPVMSFYGLSNFVINLEGKRRFGVRVRSLGSEDSTWLAPVSVNVASVVGKKEGNEALIGGRNGRFGYRVEEKKEKEKEEEENLEVLWDDGFGTLTINDYFDASKDIIRSDGGPLRWFCPVECGRPLKDSPILLYLPGMDGTGFGLILHHRPLGKAFEVRCLHIPVYDRTPFEGLVKFVEETVRLEHSLSPNKPIYLVGDSFGGCLALAVAARNPTIDLVMILSNPSTAFDKSQLQPLVPVVEAFPDELYIAVPYLVSFMTGDPIQVAMANIESRLPPRLIIEQFSGNLTALLPRLAVFADILPKDTLPWKLKLVKSGSAYVNSRLHAVRAEVLLLVSGKDKIFPSGDEARRLMKSLQNCRVRQFKDNGHTLLLEKGINLMTVIKGTCTYRRSRRQDYVSDYLPPSMSEFKFALDQVIGLYRFAMSSIMFSTLEDGNIVKGLVGVPSEGPVLLVGYHMLMGFELYSLAEEFLREKNVILRGMAHPEIFRGKRENDPVEFSVPEWIQVFGAVPVTASNFFKLLSTKSHVLLYPGGSREALHGKGEQYKLFWPDQPEFVRMAARFGATIIPFGAVGEDDITELVLDSNDLMKIPIVNDYLREMSRGARNVRDGMTGEVANQNLFVPALLPKIPGRAYFLFGKPIETKGKEEMLKDREKAKQLYFQIKSEVESCIAYLIKKREEDPYRSIVDRTVYRVLHSPHHEIPAFKP